MPLLLKDRCIGVFDLESPELDAFNKKHVELLTLLASEAAVAIENARLYESIRANEARFEKELRFAQRVQMALLPQELPKRLRGVDVAWHFDPARELGGDICDFLVARSQHARRRASATCRARACRRRSTARRSARWCAAAPSGAGWRRSAARRRRVLAGDEPHPARAATSRSTTARSATRMFEFKKQIVTFANSGLPYPGALLATARARADRHAGRAARLVRRLDLRRGPGAARRRATCSCSAPTASSRRSTRAGEEFGSAPDRRGRAGATATSRRRRSSSGSSRDAGVPRATRRRPTIRPSSSCGSSPDVAMAAPRAANCRGASPRGSLAPGEGSDFAAEDLHRDSPRPMSARDNARDAAWRLREANSEDRPLWRSSVVAGAL